MSDKTGIEWTDATWNPTKGCDKVSAGCDHCYAMTLAPRLKAMGSPAYQLDGDPRTSGPGFLAHEWPDSLDQPLRWTKPRRIFVNSMSDLFHDNISDGFIAEVFTVMARAPRHTFQILTKRHARMRSLLSRPSFRDNLAHWGAGWPLPNVWLGVSVEDQHWANIRIPALLDTPAAVRFLSCEPLLGPVNLEAWTIPTATPGHCVDIDGDWWHEPGSCAGARNNCSGRCCHAPLNWVIVGGESGPGARPMHSDWARSLRDQCVTAGVPFLFKQWGEWVTRDEPVTRVAEVVDGVMSFPHRTEIHAVTRRVGKKAAGRELDGRTWDEYPAAVHA